MTAPAFGTVGEAVRHWADISPAAPAALAPGLPPLDYAGLWRVAGQVAAALASIGTAPGSRVILLVPQSRDAEVLNTAISTTGVPVPLNPAAPPAALEALSRLLDPSLVIATAETAHAASAFGCPALLLDPALLTPGEAAFSPPPPRMPGDHAIILATSGSTGEPRLIPRTHAQLAVSTTAWLDRLGFTRDNLGLIAAPPFHAIGAHFFRHALTGSAAFIHPRADPRIILAAIRETPLTWMFGVPSWFAPLMAADDDPLPRLRMVISGSAPMPKPLAATIARRFAAPVIFDYGLSEAPCLGLSDPAADPADDPRYLPLQAGTVRVVGPDGQPLPPGTEGELVARGPILFPGEIGAAASSFDDDGWYHTGDLGIVDADGRFRVTGRLKHLVNRGGEMIAPLEIEQALLAHPGVADAAAIGVPHPALGEDLVAFVVLRPGADASRRDLRRWLLDRLAPTKVPRELIVRDRLPLTDVGKLDRRTLQAEALQPAASPPD